MKNRLIFCLIILAWLGSCATLRNMQAYSDVRCAQFNSDGTKCLRCIPRTYFDQQAGLCQPVSDLCRTWSSENGDCITCYDGYGDAPNNGRAINGTCPAYQQGVPPPFTYDENCKCYDDNYMCIECYQGYYLNQNNTCMQLPENCVAVENQTCVQCAQGYYLNETTSECLQLPEGCAEVDLEGVCVQCLSGYQWDGVQCLLLPPNCIELGSDGNCTQCQQGYDLDGQNDCNKLGEGCLNTTNNGSCAECQEGYYLDAQGQCQWLPPNCNATDTDGLCIQCVDGFFVNQDRQCQILPPNCIDANATGDCLQCESEEYIIINGECRLIAIGQPNPDCAQVGQQGECTACRTFYNLENGNCIPTGQNPFCKQGACECGTGNCLQCQDGYFLDNNYICIPIAQNCQNYSEQTGQCTVCNENFTLVEGECVPTKEEQQINLNCQQQDQNGTCTDCRRHYNLENGDCVPTGQNPKCSQFNNAGECVACYYPFRYYLDNNRICSPKNIFCHQFNPQNGDCTQCWEGFDLTDGRCVPQRNRGNRGNRGNQ